MKIGLIGCGGMGTTHNLSLKALSGKMDVEVTALADCRQEFLERAAKQWPQAKTYVTGRELLENEELDAVHICLTSYLHAEHAVLAMEKGMHVFCEKPVCFFREPLIKSARLDGERFFGKARYGKRRNTLCIARYCNAFVGQIGRQDVCGELCGDALVWNLYSQAAEDVPLPALRFFHRLSRVPLPHRSL